MRNQSQRRIFVEIMGTENLLNELVSFLKSNSTDLRYVVLKQILGLLADDSGLKLIATCGECWQQLIHLACEDDQQFIRKLGLQCLVNLSSDDELTENLALYGDSKLIKYCFESIAQRETTAETSTMLLSNLSRSSHTAKIIWDYIQDETNNSHSIEKLVELVCDKTNEENEDDWAHLAQVLCNLSQLNSVRKTFTKEDSPVMKHLIRAIREEKSQLKRKGIVGIVRNCCFDTECHEWLLSDDMDIITALVYPLAGPEELDEDENDKLPIDLQYLEADKERDPDPDIRKNLLEALLQLCATKHGRTVMKEKGIYYLLRELHKWEEVRSVVVTCENLVDILIGDEPKEDMANLKSVEIPLHLQEKFKQMDDEDQL